MQLKGVGVTWTANILNKLVTYLWFPLRGIHVKDGAYTTKPRCGAEYLPVTHRLTTALPI